MLHRFFAKFCFYDRGKATPEVIKVQQGDYLKEDDIVRLRGWLRAGVRGAFFKIEMEFACSS
ncbi:hypothetical protein HY00_10905 [Peptococcaceae bacterium SCADC1_2_3]|nr:hypothetical protein HY00_10905 [Peptococcaceae bacterium SCADC1_2_3]